MHGRDIGAVNGRMTIGAAAEKRLLHLLAAKGALGGHCSVMAGMALHAEEWLGDLEQVVVG
jgi:hypothetical protein